MKNFYGAAHKGSKQFTQQEVKTATATGFGAAADDYMDRGIDLNEQLITKPATFFFRMTGETMIGAGIHHDDVLIVDRSITATNGKIIVAVVDGELLVRRLQLSFNKMILVAENKNHAPVEIGQLYKKAGVMLSGIVPDESIQGNLFLTENKNCERKLMDMIDNVNFSQRDDVLKFSSSGITRDWKMRQELRSGRYTTRWEELFEIS